MDAKNEEDGISLQNLTKIDEHTHQTPQKNENPPITNGATCVETTVGMSGSSSCTRNVQEREQTTSNPSITTTTFAPDSTIHNNTHSEPNHTSKGCDPPSPGAEPRSYITVAPLEGIVGSTSSNSMVPPLLFPMGSRVPFVDVLETATRDCVAACDQKDRSYIFQTFVNPNYQRRERHQERQSHRLTLQYPPKQHEYVPIEVVSSDTASSDKVDVNGKHTDETGEETRRRSGRKRKQVMPFQGDRIYGSKVDDIEFPNFLQQFCAIVELPDELGPGDLMLVVWPETEANRPPNGLFVPQIFWIEIPETVPFPRLNSKRLLKVMAPGCNIADGKKRRSGGRGGRYTTATTPKNARSPAFQSPQKAEWFSYQKSASRVGHRYQVPGLPIRKTPMDVLVEPAVEG